MGRLNRGVCAYFVLTVTFCIFVAVGLPFSRRRKVFELCNIDFVIYTRGFRAQKPGQFHGKGEPVVTVL